MEHTTTTLRVTAPPSRLRLFPAVWIAAFVVITTFQALVGPVIEAWPLPLRTLLMSGVMVAILMGVIEPLIVRVVRARRVGS